MMRDHVSEWVNLTKGEKYYMYAKHFETSGGDNFAVGVEIKQTNSTVIGHHHAMKEVQYVSIFPSNPQKEVTRISVTNPPETGNFYLSFQIPGNNSYWSSGPIPYKASASQVKNAL